MTPRAISQSNWSWIIFALIFLVAAGLRCWHLGRESFWLDEVYSVESSMGRGFAHRLLPVNTIIDRPPDFFDSSRAQPWWHIWPACTGPTGDWHPPLPYILLRWWGDLFGHTEIAARSLSVAASLISVLLLFLIARDLHGNFVALWACLIMALAGPQIQYAQEAKHYALLQAMGLAACLAMVRIEKRGGSVSRHVALGIAVLALLFTHYFSLGPIAALGLYALFRLRGKDRRNAVFAMAAAIVLFLVAWGPSILWQARLAAADTGYFQDSTQGYLPRWLDRLALIPYRLLNEPLPGSGGPAHLCAAVWIVSALLLRRRPDLLLWVLWMPLAILPAALLDLARHTWLLVLIRYTLVAGPAVYVLFAALPSRSHLALRPLLPLLVAFSCLVALRDDVYSHHKNDIRAIGHELLARAAPGDVTVFCCPTDPQRGPALYFICTAYYARPFPGPVLLLTDPADAHLLQQLRARDHVWVIGDSPELSELLPGAEVGARRFIPGTGNVSRVTWPATAPSPRIDR